MEKVRFEVTLNGEHLCTAGVDGYGVLNATFTMAKLAMADEPVADCTENSLRYELNLDVGGLECNDSQENKYLVWAYRTLNTGDEVVVRLLPDGEHDPPISSYLDHASSCVMEEDRASEAESHGRPPAASPEGEFEAGNVRLEFLHNGRRLCIAGLEDKGVIGAHISVVTRHPNHARDYHADGMNAEDERYMAVQGLDSSQPDAHARLIWIREKTLCPGDEICVLVLPPGEYDPPRRLPTAKK